MQNILKILMYSSISMVFLFIISKIAGKKQIAQLCLIDFVFAISVGSITAEMATDLDDTPFYLYLIAMAVFLFIKLVLGFLERKGPVFKNLFKGQPITIINEGNVDYKNLKKSKLDINELLMLCRNAGYFDLKNIAFAVFETNGELSILPKGSQKPTVAEDLGIPLQPTSLPSYLITEGKISSSGLKNAGKTENWLLKELNVKNKKEVKKILLATYDEESDTIITTKRD